MVKYLHFCFDESELSTVGSRITTITIEEHMSEQ
jgi:hypothetical protein